MKITEICMPELRSDVRIIAQPRGPAVILVRSRCHETHVQEWGKNASKPDPKVHWDQARCSAICGENAWLRTQRSVDATRFMQVKLESPDLLCKNCLKDFLVKQAA